MLVMEYIETIGRNRVRGGIERVKRGATSEDTAIPAKGIICKQSVMEMT
jgi:hypothetical protein